MEIIYEGVDISSSVSVKKADIIDNAGGVADSLELVFIDTEGRWSEWQPKKGHTVEIQSDDCTSGAMFVDHLEQNRGTFCIKALSTPLQSKTECTNSWENVRFNKIANEVANKYGFALNTYNVIDHLYARVDQIESTDFLFLANKCMLEGYSLKINDKKIIIYDEKYLDSQEASINIDSTEFDGDFSFKSMTNGLFGSCKITSNSNNGIIKSEFKPLTAPVGPMLKKNIIVSSQGEADRYCKGLLRATNKYETTGYISIKLNPGIAAGTIVNITNVGIFDGKYIVDRALHRLVSDKSHLKLRKPLEGY